MKLTLMITASASALSKILAGLDDDVVVVTAPVEQDDDSDEDVQPTGELDSTGLPWDERIHASTRTQTAKGVWKKRKGVNEQTMTAVENELRARDSLPVPLPVGIPVAPMAPIPTPAPVAPPVVPAPASIPTIPLLPQADAPVAPPMVAPTPVPAPVAAPAPAASPAPESIDMMTLMTKIAAGQTAGTLDADYVNDLVKRVGTAFNQPINSVVDMMSKPDMLTYTAQLMQHDGKW